MLRRIFGTALSLLVVTIFVMATVRCSTKKVMKSSPEVDVPPTVDSSWSESEQDSTWSDMRYLYPKEKVEVRQSQETKDKDVKIMYISQASRENTITGNYLIA